MQDEPSVTEALLPCPFCGSKASFYDDHSIDPYAACDGATSVFCDARGSTADSLTAAATAWNRRAALAQPKPGEMGEPEHYQWRWKSVGEKWRSFSPPDILYDEIETRPLYTADVLSASHARAEALQIDASNHAADAETVRRERDALQAENAILQGRLETAYRVKAECNDMANFERGLRLKAEAEVDRLRQAADYIGPYLRWTISDESPGHHPTMPSAVAAFHCAFDIETAEKRQARLRSSVSRARASLHAGEPPAPSLNPNLDSKPPT